MNNDESKHNANDPIDFNEFLSSQLNLKLQTSRIESPISEGESSESSTYVKQSSPIVPRRYVPLPPQRKKRHSPNSNHQLPHFLRNGIQNDPQDSNGNDRLEYDPYDDGVTANEANITEEIYEVVNSDEECSSISHIPSSSGGVEEAEEGIYETLSDEEGHYEAADSIDGSTETEDGEDDVEYDEATLYEEIDSYISEEHEYENGSFLVEKDSQKESTENSRSREGATIYAQVITPKEISRKQRTLKKNTSRSQLSRDENTKKELRLLKKREAIAEKLKERFNLTGEEIPVNSGTVKKDSKGTRHDLMVKKGETVLVLRMEGNPPGKWLAKSERGKIGYVDIANITVDPESVKTIMKQAQRLLCENR